MSTNASLGNPSLVVIVGSGDADWIPDYTVDPSTYHLETPSIESNNAPSRQSAFYRGAFFTLNLLGVNETMPDEDLIILARSLIHECKYFLEQEKKNGDRV